MGRRKWLRAGAVAAACAAAVLQSLVASAYAPSMGPAAAPILVSPIDGITITSAPVLKWKSGVNASEYLVRVWPAGQPAKVLCTTGGPLASASCEGDLPPGQYEWTVQSMKGNGQPDGLSVVGTFTRATPAIAAPVLLTPANGATLDYPDDLGVLRWAAAAGAVHYEVQVSTSPAFAEASPNPEFGSVILSADVPRDHIGETQYWRVRGVNAARTWAGPWSATRSFTVTWPEVPGLVSPPDGGSASNIMLAWNPVKGASRYDIQVTSIADLDFSDAIITWQDGHSTGWGDTPAGDLRWRVRGWNTFGGVTAWSTARTIHRDATAPAAPPADPIDPPNAELVAPLDGATVPSSAEVELEFTPVAGALMYEIDIHEQGGPWGALGLKVGAGPIRWRFDPGDTFEWRVRAIGEGNVNGAWSQVRSLSVSDPAPITLLTPAGGGDLPGSAQTVSWQPVAGVVNYRVEVDDDPDFTDWTDFGAYRFPSISANLGIREAGRWYWRVRGGAFGTDALSEVRAVDIIDDIAPAGLVNMNFATTNEPAIPIYVAAQDALGTVVEVHLSADGVAWESQSMPASEERDVTWSLTSATHGGSSPGQRHVHARFRDDSGNWSAVVSASTWYGMAPPPDETAPSGSISVANGAAFTRTRYPVIAIPATDVSGVTEIALSTDGVSWVERPYWPEQQVVLPGGSGTKTVRVKWKDDHGNWSAVKSDTIILDTVQPTATAPGTSFVKGSTLNSTLVATRFTWTGADAASGIAFYEASLSTDGGSFATLSTTLTSASLSRSLAPSHTYRLRVRAVDKVGNVGAWVYGSTFTLSAYQETSSRIRYAGTWTRSSGSALWGGYEKWSGAAGGRATLTFTGRAFAWVGCVGPTRGSAKVYVNGVLKATVNLYASSTSCRRVLAALSWSSSASRQVRIVVSGTAGHPKVGVDALLTAT